jgi:ribosome modulation factor
MLNKMLYTNPTPDQAERLHCWQLGRNACLEGKTIEQCPYNDSLLEYFWKEGFSGTYVYNQNE